MDNTDIQKKLQFLQNEIGSSRHRILKLEAAFGMLAGILNLSADEIRGIFKRADKFADDNLAKEFPNGLVLRFTKSKDKDIVFLLE